MIPFNQDKLLADKVVALGVGEKDTFRPDMYTLGKFESVRYEADKYVRDWRVAGVCLEKALQIGFMTLAAVVAKAIDDTGNAKSGSLPRALIEAYVEASE
ncbi:hypothetical protein LCGC14_3128560 [marine sediment metagenome]|uniref:Uncharacterized protein n=1 Tax=marine sediment metagenome TaxID=412755 RepID=A0A0F8W0F3_9ZZZZ